jgi:hypothetical protein
MWNQAFEFSCKSQDLTFHTLLSDQVATLRQDPWERILRVMA